MFLHLEIQRNSLIFCFGSSKTLKYSAKPLHAKQEILSEVPRPQNTAQLLDILFRKFQDLKIQRKTLARKARNSLKFQDLKIQRKTLARKARKTLKYSAKPWCVFLCFLFLPRAHPRAHPK